MPPPPTTEEGLVGWQRWETWGRPTHAVSKVGSHVYEAHSHRGVGRGRWENPSSTGVIKEARQQSRQQLQGRSAHSLLAGGGASLLLYLRSPGAKPTELLNLSISGSNLRECLWA